MRGSAVRADTFEKARRRSRAQRLTPEARRAHLLECATQVFARRGIAGARHTEVASNAGVAVPTTFAYFPTREDLVAAVLDSVERLFLDLATRVHASKQPALQVLLEHARAFASVVDDRPDETRVLLNWSTAVGGDTWPRYRVFEDCVASELARTIARGQREGSINADYVPLQGARIVIGAAYQIAQMKLSGRPQDEVAAFVDALGRILAGGLAAARSAG